MLLCPAQCLNIQYSVPLLSENLYLAGDSAATTDAGAIPNYVRPNHHKKYPFIRD